MRLRSVYFVWYGKILIWEDRKFHIPSWAGALTLLYRSIAGVCYGLLYGLSLYVSLVTCTTQKRLPSGSSNTMKSSSGLYLRG
jgi:hypothetical protein